ncbi:trypsin-like cysteine/serine peptidase domain-containing protein [Rostrohypoxylon terebratum]|nr:trypsin-like cysteine/serine peptidase domain-containing protein [Rostrohypoxylon terebratum]
MVSGPHLVCAHTGMLAYDPKAKDGFGSGVVVGNGKCVITAAHVVDAVSLSDIKVFENKVQNDMIVPTGNTISVARVTKHPYYKGTSEPHEGGSAFDMAVVELTTKMEANPWKVSQTRGKIHQNTTLYGWGTLTASPSKYPEQLRSGANKIVSTSDRGCKQWYEIVGAICMMNEDGTAVGLNCGGDLGGGGQL